MSKEAEAKKIICALKRAYLVKVNRVVILFYALEVINAINGEEYWKISRIILDIHSIVRLLIVLPSILFLGHFLKGL